MAGGIVGWHFFDVDSGLVPEDASLSSLPSGGRGRIVALAATPFSLSDGWAARAAVTLAKEWSGEGLKIFLMDLGLESPTLHTALDLPNGEGVSDAFLYGASVQHIAKPVLDGAFFFASAGSPPGDSAAVLGHPRWNDLAGGFSEADATLILLLPTDIPGAGKILSRASEIVFLSAKSEEAETHLGPASIKMVAAMGPFGSPPVEETEAPEAVEEEPGGVEEASEEEAEPAEKSDADGFDLDLDLAQGFGSPGAGDDPSAVDLSGDFELAAGFGVVEAEGDPEADEDPLVPEFDAGSFDEGEDPLALAEEADFGEPPDSEETPDFSGDLELMEEESSDEFGDDLVMGASLSGRFEEDGEDSEDSSGAPPDFQSDFVDLGPVEDAPDEEGEFGGDLVQGADFGVPSAEDFDAAPELDAGPVDEPVSSTGEDAPVQETLKEAPKRRRPPKKPFPWGLSAAVVLFLTVVGAVVGTAFGYLNVPGLTFLQSSFGEVPEPPLTLAGPQPNEEVLRFSLVLFTYDEEEISAATDMLDALRSRLPELLFALVPGEVDGEAVYTLLAGPAIDRIEAEDLRGPLAGVLSREDPDSWTVRETPRAFYLGERETYEDALEYMNSLGTDGVYPYILHVTYPDGSEAFEILAGAFEGVLDARPLQMLLRSGAFRDAPLIERRGRLPE